MSKSNKNMLREPASHNDNYARNSICFDSLNTMDVEDIFALFDDTRRASCSQGDCECNHEVEVDDDTQHVEREQQPIALRFVNALIEAYECGLRCATLPYIIEVGVMPFIGNDVNPKTLSVYASELARAPRMNTTKCVVKTWQNFCGFALMELDTGTDRMILLNIDALCTLRDSWHLSSSEREAQADNIDRVMFM